MRQPRTIHTKAQKIRQNFKMAIPTRVHAFTDSSFIFHQHARGHPRRPSPASSKKHSTAKKLIRVNFEGSVRVIIRMQRDTQSEQNPKASIDDQHDCSCDLRPPLLHSVEHRTHAIICSTVSNRRFSAPQPETTATSPSSLLFLKSIRLGGRCIMRSVVTRPHTAQHSLLQQSLR